MPMAHVNPIMSMFLSREVAFAKVLQVDKPLAAVSAWQRPCRLSQHPQPKATTTRISFF
jgi:hypothetical protein